MLWWMKFTNAPSTWTFYFSFSDAPFEPIQTPFESCSCRRQSTPTPSQRTLAQRPLEGSPLGHRMHLLGSARSLDALFPVVEHFLEAAVAHTGYRLDRRSEWARDSPLPETASLGAGGKAAAEASNAQAAAQAARAKADAEGTAATALVAHNLEERAEKLANAAAASAASRSIGGVATEQMRAEGVAGTAARCGGADVASTLRTMDLSCVNEELVEALVLRHHRAAAGGGGGGDCGGHGAILVFMPGVAEIERLCDRLEALRGTPLHIVRLHSQLSTAEQRIAFLPPPTPGQTKVVVATDIAETSVTIPDVVLVIDGGLHRMLACDDRASHAPHLKMARISLAAAKQRAGRAGRVRAGVCYHLYSEVEARAGAGMNETLPAEIRRVPLDGTILQLRGLVRTYPALRHASATTLLAEFLEPPEAAAVDRATRALAGLGALRIDTDGGEVLTSLGARLCRLGVEPRLGRTLLCADVLGCLCAASVVVAGMEPPTDPFGRGARAGEARRRLDSTSCHLALLRAHGEWKRAASFGGGHERRATCEGLGVSDAAMRQVDQRARRIEELVHQSRGEEMAWRAASKQVAKVIRQMAREDLALAVTEAGVSAMRRLSRHACYVVVARRS